VRPILGVLLGEAAGIGPEIVAKLCAQDRVSPYCRPVLIGDIRVLKLGQKIAGVEFPVCVIEDIAQASWEGPMPVLDQKNLDPATIKLGQIDANSGRVTGDMLVTALRLCQQGAIAGFAFAPFNKAALHYGGHTYFKDAQGLFARYLKWTGPYGEINVVHDLWTSRVTSHIPLKDVSAHLSIEKLMDAIKLVHTALSRAGFIQPRIAVAALNPHGGEDGLCGREEIDIIAPAVKAAQAAGMNALGPFPADTLFIKAFEGAYDAVTTMYHDQGQIAIKLMDFQYGVSVLAGLPYPITTPAHGTAFDIAGKGCAKSNAMEQAVIIAAKMAGWRQGGNRSS
jgi:4-hydroxythreonine-4-phosphate dehydrogenase